MKTYEKPKLIALSISGNNMLCSTCDIDIMGDNADPVFQETYLDFFDEKQLFDEPETCAVEVEGYCKFTAVSNVVINS